MDEEIFLTQMDRIDDLPTLPSIALEVNRMLTDENASMDALSQLIEKDPAMVQKLLKLVNSAFFGLRTKIGDVRRAISILGFNTVRNAVLSLSVIQSFTNGGALSSIDMRTFWTHSIAVGTIGRFMAGKAGCSSPEEAFTAGILHDIGKLILAQYFSDLLEDVMTTAKENKTTFYDAEKQLKMVSHDVIGSHLSRRWRLPESLADIIRYHHQMDGKKKNAGLTEIIHVSDMIVNVHEQDKASLADISMPALINSGLTTSLISDAHEWLPDVFGDIETSCRVFMEA